MRNLVSSYLAPCQWEPPIPLSHTQTHGGVALETPYCRSGRNEKCLALCLCNYPARLHANSITTNFVHVLPSWAPTRGWKKTCVIPRPPLVHLESPGFRLSKVFTFVSICILERGISLGSSVLWRMELNARSVQCMRAGFQEIDHSWLLRFLADIRVVVSVWTNVYLSEFRFIIVRVRFFFP